MIVYSVCYYYGKNDISNILKHVRSFMEVKMDSDIFILEVMVDSNDPEALQSAQSELLNILSNTDVEKYAVLPGFNWGGTILGLWMVYQYTKAWSHDTYICHFEEDFLPINSGWLDASKRLLSQDKYIYVGEHTPSVSNPEQNTRNTKYVKEDRRPVGPHQIDAIYNHYNCSINDSRWTDGGYYFSSIGNLKKISDRVGIFHRGNPNTKYDRSIDGIILGEVGFPSLLHVHFDFIGLLRSDYFRHNDSSMDAGADITDT